MRKVTLFLMALIAGVFAMQVNAQPAKAPARSAVYSYLPSGYIALGSYDNPNHIYYSTQRQTAVPMGNVHGISIIGEVDGKYYSTTYAKASSDNASNAGAGFIAAMKVDGPILDHDAVLCDCQSGTTSHDVRFTARVEPAGEFGAKVIYTLTNNAWLTSRTVSLGVWADIMIGDNDNAPIYRLVNNQGKVYGLDMKYKNEEDAEPGEKIPVFTAIFGGVSGITPADDYWFGQFRNNYENNEIVGNYDNLCDIQIGTGDDATFQYDVVDEFFMTEGGSYDSGLGFCWKNITLEAGETVELSFIVSASEIDIDEPEPDPDEEYNVEVYNTEAWNDLAADHPARVWGYYKHPFDWTSHIEYMVDGDRGTGEWTAIPGELTPNSEFELTFNMNFNPDVADIHTLKLRIVDVEGNPTYLTDLNKEWEDVRNIDLTVNPQTQYYDGTPKTFVVTVGGVLDYTLGEDGGYVEPGTYDFSIYGDYDMETIGINTVEFSIVRRQAGLDVQVPEDCVYDGEEHPATATCDGDGNVIITYKDAEGNISTEAPVEPGTYEVFVEVTDGEFYDGIENTSYGTFTIDKAQSEITYTVPEDCVYDGEAHAATAELVKGDGELTITYVSANGETSETSTEAPVEPGTYSVVVTVTETDRYYGLEETIGTFTIDKAQSEIEYTIPEDCVYDGEAHAATVVLVKGDGVLTVTYVKNTRDGEASTDAPVVPGTYSVVVKVTETDHYYGLEETIGSFTIDKAPCVYEVIVPESVEHDGEGHPATVIVTQGGEPIVTYLNTVSDKISADDPVDIGEYYVIVEIPETDLYYGLPSTMFGPFEIYDGATSLQEMNAAREGDNAWYTIQGIRVPAPTAPGIYIHNGKKYIVK